MNVAGAYCLILINDAYENWRMIAGALLVTSCMAGLGIALGLYARKMRA